MWHSRPRLWPERHSRGRLCHRNETMSRDEFKAYDLLAIHAGNALGLGVPTMAQAAELSDKELAAFAKIVDADAKGKALREELAAAFEVRLLGRENLDDITDWFNGEYGAGLPEGRKIITRTSIHRVRTAMRAKTDRIEECSKSASAVMSVLKGKDASAVFDASTELAGQYIFQLLLEFSADPDKRPDAERGAKLIGALAKLQQSKAVTDLTNAKLRDLQTKFDAEMKARQAGSSDGKLTPDMIREARVAIFGTAANEVKT